MIAGIGSRFDMHAEINKGGTKDVRIVAIGILCLFAAWAGSVICVQRADRSKTQDWNQSSLLYLPAGKLLKPMALDFDEAVADLIWVQGMLYFSEEYIAHLGYEWMGHILDVVTTLNVRLQPAYEFTGTILVKNKEEWPMTRKLLERGISAFPEDWKLRVYLALPLMKFDSNYVAAAEALKPVSLLPGVPDHIRLLSVTLLEKGGGERVALAFLVDRYLHSSDAINRDIFLDRILKIFSDNSGAPKDKELIRKLIDIAGSDSRAEATVLSILSEYLQGALSPNSQRVLKRLNLQ